MASFVRYVSAGAAAYSVPFSYIARSHVQVRVDGDYMVADAHYDWTGESTITFRPQFVPIVSAIVEIKRQTPVSTPLVSYQGGTVLTADDLNTATKQAIFSAEETRDYYTYMLEQGFARLNNGTAVPVQDAIDAAVQEVLNSALLASLQTRYVDIDLNAESILDQALRIETVENAVDALTDPGGGGIITLINNETNARIEADTAIVTDIGLIGARSGDNLSFILDLDTVKVGPTESLAQRLSYLTAQDGANASTAASIIDLTVSPTSALALKFETIETNVGTLSSNYNSIINLTVDSGTALAQKIETLEIADGDNAGAIQGVSEIVSGPGGLTGQYSVKIDANNKVVGFGLYNSPTSTDFIVVADKFAVVDPANTAAAPKVPFLVSNGIVYMQNVVIGDALIDSLTVNKLTAGSLVAQITQNADWYVGTGRIIWDNGTYLKAAGVGFGSSGQFLEWFGPRPAGANLALCTEANAITYLKTNGDAYFGGSLSLGTLRNSVSNSTIGSGAVALLGPFGTNGGSKTVAYSFTLDHHQTWMLTSGNFTPDYTQDATVVLQRRIGGGAWTTVGGPHTVTASVSYYDCPVNGELGEYQVTASGSFTITDNNTSTSDFEYQLYFTGWNIVIRQGGSVSTTQRLTIVSTEE